MSNYYIDIDGVVHDKEGMDFRIDQKKHNGIGLREINKDQMIEAIKLSDIEILEGLVNRAKEDRDSYVSSDLESGGYLWQVRNAADLQNIQDGIDESVYDPSKIGETISFRMADNTWQDIVIADLEKAKSDYRIRKLEVYSQFKAWTETDMIAPFEI